jgi:hypothetical protein
MRRVTRNLFVLAVLLGSAATAAANYNTTAIGPSGPSNFDELCTDFHLGNPSRVKGIEGGSSSSGSHDLWNVRELCQGGIGGAIFGTNWGSTPTTLLCQSNFFVNKLRGYYSSSRLNSLSATCHHSSGVDSEFVNFIGGNQTGSFRSVSCGGSDVAWGIWGSLAGTGQSTLKRVGLICAAN